MIKLLLFSLLALPSLSFAIFCPKNFNQFDYGSTVTAVIAACGKPDFEETKEIPLEGPQEWSYFIPQTVSTTALTPMQGTLRTQVTFDAGGNAINISVNGIGVGNSTICGGNLIQLGDSRDKIKSICGDPSFVNKQNTSPIGTKQPADKITTLIYNSNPPVKLLFKNGIFTEKR